MTSPGPHEIDIEVRYAETDQMGVVHHANYLIWFELARTELCARSGLHYRRIEEAGYFLVVTQVELKYRQGARYGDRVRLSCELEHLGTRGMRFRYEVRRQSELLTSGRTHHIWVEAASARPCRIPEMARPFFESMSEGQA
jgi:acyl-CoA thioester hydrolase